MNHHHYFDDQGLDHYDLVHDPYNEDTDISKKTDNDNKFTAINQLDQMIFICLTSYLH